jgi:hypothetical protein
VHSVSGYAGLHGKSDSLVLCKVVVVIKGISKAWLQGLQIFEGLDHDVDKWVFIAVDS